jgi:asparagine synthetase B (glutamine-hydrolysing)
MRMSGRGRSGAELLLRTAYGLLPAGLTSPVRTAVAPYFTSYSAEGRSLQVIRRELDERYGDRRLGWLETRASTMHDLGKRLYADVFQFSLPCLLRYADRNSMAFSIESRMPLLDYRLVEHVFSLPLSMIVRDGWTKWVFRKALEGRLPPDVQWRKDKMGFVTPEGGWLRDGKHHLVEGLSGPLLSEEFLDTTHVRQRLDEYVKSTSDTARYTDVFRWYILEAWMRHAFGSPRTTS